MTDKTVSLEISEASIATLDEIAANREVDRAAILREAVALYLADYADLKADLEQADREIESGQLIDHEDVVAWFKAQHPAAKDSEAA